MEIEKFEIKTQTPNMYLKKIKTKKFEIKRQICQLIAFVKYLHIITSKMTFVNCKLWCVHVQSTHSLSQRS